ncbi:MAG: dihydroneopterin aldolase [Ferruginibacter sp.]
MYTIHLTNLRFFAHHGIHAEEEIVGNDFEVSVAVSFEVTAEISALSQTVNYVSLYNIIKKIFIHPAKLLETLATDICEGIHASDQRIKKINITIHKLNPPIGNFTGSVGVSFCKTY